MIIRKELPDQGELVLVKINKIMPFGAYCELTDYKIDAYLPIGEVASGWIKNIHEFIKEGQKDVAKVVFVNRDKRAVDISLKKVSGKEKKDTINAAGLEKRAEGLFGQAIAAAKAEPSRASIIQQISAKYQSYAALVDDIVAQQDPLKDLQNSGFKKALYEIVRENIKPKVYSVSYTIELKSLNTRAGIEKIKEVLGEVAKQGVSVLYVGAPHYKVSAEGASYHEAEKKIHDLEKVFALHSKDITFTMTSNKV